MKSAVQRDKGDVVLLGIGFGGSARRSVNSKVRIVSVKGVPIGTNRNVGVKYGNRSQVVCIIEERPIVYMGDVGGESNSG